VFVIGQKAASTRHSKRPRKFVARLAAWSARHVSAVGRDPRFTQGEPPPSSRRAGAGAHNPARRWSAVNGRVRRRWLCRRQQKGICGIFPRQLDASRPLKPAMCKLKELDPAGLVPRSIKSFRVSHTMNSQCCPARRNHGLVQFRHHRRGPPEVNSQGSFISFIPAGLNIVIWRSVKAAQASFFLDFPFLAPVK